MTDVRYYLGCAHEQYPPRELLEIAVAGEEAGFDGITCSDHLQPWWEGGQSGHAWFWLGAAAQATNRVPVGPAVTVALVRITRCSSPRASGRSSACIRAASSSASAPASR
jgi:hypothetical protein